jgi:hypothetical protein
MRWGRMNDEIRLRRDETRYAAHAAISAPCRKSLATQLADAYSAAIDNAARLTERTER